MSADKAKTNTDWTEIKGKIQAKWSKLVSTDLDSLKGKVDLITQKMQNALDPATPVKADPKTKSN